MLKMMICAAVAAMMTAPAAYAASPVSAEQFPQFASCPNAAGTWWNTNPADKYSTGHRVQMAIVNGKLHFAVDANPDRVMTPLREVRSITPSRQNLEIVTASGTKYILARQGNLLVGEMHYSSGVNKLEFDCTRRSA